jgi:hypothetical protein
MDIPCKACGHSEYKHSQMYCFECFEEDRQMVPKNSALRGTHFYLADNLSYIENLAKERNLV